MPDQNASKALKNTCPKCGFNQNSGMECLRCGLIFSRIHLEQSPSPYVVQEEEIKIRKRPSVSKFRRCYRIFRWASLAGVLLVVILIFSSSSPPHVIVTADAAQRAQTKVQEFQSSVHQGVPDTLRMDESEVNGWINTNLVLKGTQDAVNASPVKTQEPEISPSEGIPEQKENYEEAVKQAQSSIRDVKVELREDQLHLYAVFDLHGMKLTMELEGQLMNRNGYLYLDISGGKLGSLPILPGVLQKATDRLFNSPENKEKFRLPSHVREVRIDRGQLLVLSR